jgi:hypothetical protein
MVFERMILPQMMIANPALLKTSLLLDIVIELGKSE